MAFFYLKLDKMFLAVVMCASKFPVMPSQGLKPNEAKAVAE